MEGSESKAAPPEIERGLPTLGVRREVRIAGIRVAGRRRRPSGERAPLQRDLRAAGKLWLVAGILMVAIWVTLFAFPATTDWWTRNDNAVVGWFFDIRTTTLTNVADAIATLGTSWFVRILRIATLLALIFIRRWRHFFAVILAVLIVQATVEIIGLTVGRPRPFVPIIGDWEGPSHPSRPVANLGVTLAAMAYALVPTGRRRHLFLGASGALIGLLIVAQLYLGADHPSDAFVAAIFSGAVTVVLFRWFAPEAAFPFTGNGESRRTST